jgi:hypothetical protein
MRLCNDAIRNRHSAAKRNVKYELTETEQTGSWQRTEITPVLPITGLEFPRYLGTVFFAVFQNSHRIKICVLLGYYVACGGNSLPTFWDNLSV